jgi:hypothetical protein
MIRCNVLFCRILIAASLYSASFSKADEPNHYRTISDDVDKKYTSVGNIGLTVTNFGTIGTRNAYWPKQPSCEYPRGSRIEHIYQGALWVGAVVKTSDSTSPRNGLILVTTGATGRSTLGDGYEFNAEANDSVIELSTLSEDRPATSEFSALAVSHQDFISEYSDRFTRVPSTNDSILNHTPMGIKVHQESYAWNFPFADFFVLLRYVIYNTSPDTLDSVYVGMWDNAVVRNTNNVQPRATGYFDNTGHGYDAFARMEYSFDFSGAPAGPPADSYVGVKLLGTTPFPSGVDSIGNLYLHTYFNVWDFRPSALNPALFAPTDDYRSDNPYLSRYSRLTQSTDSSLYPIIKVPNSHSYNTLLSTGPFHQLNPGDSLEVVFAVVCAKKFGNDPASLNTRDQRKNLYTNSGWAEQAYEGEDANGNNQLDPGEDIARRDSVSPTEFGLRYEPDGKITRYLLPAPPRRPKVHPVNENQHITIYWDKASSEESVDPISGLKDFEGYRVYQSKTGADFQHPEDFVINLSLVGEFDRSDDNIGYNTGFGRILLDSSITFPGDTLPTGELVKYWYRFPPKDVNVSSLNGWQYIYAVSAFDKGDSANNVPSLESAKTIFRLIPGTPPTSDKSVPIGVYPNPYYVNAYWDGAKERLRKIYFYNLPARCQITVYTLAGDVVTVLDHDSSRSNGEGIQWFSQFGDRQTQPQFAGGEHAWDLITRFDQAIATGLYLFTVEDINTGTIKRGKFLIIK